MTKDELYEMNTNDFFFIAGVKHFLQEWIDDDHIRTCISEGLGYIFNLKESLVQDWSKNNAPSVPGLYWARNSNVFNLIMEVQGEAPFLTLRAYNIFAGRVDTDIHPKAISEWGPRIEVPHVVSFMFKMDTK